MLGVITGDIRHLCIITGNNRQSAVHGDFNASFFVTEILTYFLKNELKKKTWFSRFYLVTLKKLLKT